MAKYLIASVLLVVVLTVFSCETARPKAHPNHNRQFARQEVEESITPYPSADELKPEIPFEEAAIATEEPVIFAEESVPAHKAAASEVIRDEVSGPPEVSVIYNTPDEVYSPPETDISQSAAKVVLARQQERQARLIKTRRQAAYRQAHLANLDAVKVQHTA